MVFALSVALFTAPAKEHMDEFTRELIAAFARVRQISHGEMLNTREIWLECLSDVARVGGHEFALIVLRRRMKQWTPTIEES